MTTPHATHDALTRWEQDGGTLRPHSHRVRHCAACGSEIAVHLQSKHGEIGFCLECREGAQRPVIDAELGGESG